VPAAERLCSALGKKNRILVATASVGDPVLCHLIQVSRELGRTVFPGKMIAGNLEEDKDTGHFVGERLPENYV